MMDRRGFLATFAALPLLEFEPWVPTYGVQELILPQDLATALERHCLLPLKEGVVRADEGLKIAESVSAKSGLVCEFATHMYSDEWKLDYVCWSWFHSEKRWKQIAIARQIASAGEFSVVKRDDLFVLQTTKCKLPAFRTSDRRLIVNYDDEWNWSGLGGGWPSFIRGNDLHFMRADWFHLAIDVFGSQDKPEFFDGDVLRGEITKQLANRLLQPDIDPDPWPGMGFGWQDIAHWLSQGDCLFVPFPKQPMI
jgi:hypothetical protein